MIRERSSRFCHTHRFTTHRLCVDSFLDEKINKKWNMPNKNSLFSLFLSICSFLCFRFIRVPNLRRTIFSIFLFFFRVFFCVADSLLVCLYACRRLRLNIFKYRWRICHSIIIEMVWLMQNMFYIFGTLKASKIKSEPTN